MACLSNSCPKVIKMEELLTEIKNELVAMKKIVESGLRILNDDKLKEKTLNSGKEWECCKK